MKARALVCLLIGPAVVDAKWPRFLRSCLFPCCVRQHEAEPVGNDESTRLLRSTANPSQLATYHSASAVVASSFASAASADLSRQHCGGHPNPLCGFPDTHLLDSSSGTYMPAITRSTPLGGTVCSHDSFTVVSKLIGKGKFGMVYRALHRESGLVVALKYIKYLPDELSLLSHVRQEECLQHRLNHPGITRHYCTFDYRKGGDQYVVLVLEYVDGDELWVAIHEPDQAKYWKSYGLANILTWSMQLVLIVEALHRESVVLLDMKPENLIVDPSGNVHLIDFGLAGDPENPSRYSCGRRMGTIAFIAPEQFSNFGDWHQPGADWYSMGLVLYEILYKCLPFKGTDTADIEHAMRRIRGGFPCHRLGGELDNLSDLIEGFTESNPRFRFGVALGSSRAIRSHPWFRDLDFGHVLALYT